MHDNAFVAALEQMPAAKMRPVVSLGVGRAEPMHGFFQIGLASTHQQMVMIVHQHIGIHVHLEALRHLAGRIQKNKSVLLVNKDVTTLIAAR